MYKMILLSFIFCLLSCNPSAKKQSDSKQNNPNTDEIVFIFKKQNPEQVSDTNTEILGSPIYYSENSDFVIIELTPNNKAANDTVIKKVTRDKICLSHTYNKTQKFLYEFQKGDTIVFDYEKGYPYATVTNRKTLPFDNNFLADIKIEKPLGFFEFFSKNKRIRNETENKAYFKELEDYKGKLNNTLDSLLKINQIAQSVYELHKASIRFFEMNTNKALLRFATIDDLKRDDLLYLKTYRYFLSNYIVDKFKLKTQFSNDSMSCNSKTAFDSIVQSSLFSKRVKESLLYDHLTNIAENYSTADLNTYFKKFKEIVNDPTLNEIIENNYLLDLTKWKEEVKEVYFINLNKEKKTLENLILKNKGKVIYIDFWASWCAPCRAAMPSSRKLKEEYKNKDVVFIYISTDSDFEKWKKASEKEQLVATGNNVLAVNYPAAHYYKELQLTTIPRYVIYDKNGKLAHKNAPSPESKTIRDELDNYLKE